MTERRGEVRTQTMKLASCASACSVQARGPLRLPVTGL